MKIALNMLGKFTDIFSYISLRGRLVLSALELAFGAAIEHIYMDVQLAYGYKQLLNVCICMFIACHFIYGRCLHIYDPYMDVCG